MSQITIEEALSRPGSKTLFVPTTSGAMKVRLGDYLYTYHYRKDGIARYRCLLFGKSKCPASVVIKGLLTYPFNVEHNHAPNEIPK